MNVFWVGEMRRKFDGATVVERAAACAARVKGHVIIITRESRKARNISGSAQRVPRGTSMFFASDSCPVGEELPLAATVYQTSCSLGRGSQLAESQLKRLLGARKHGARPYRLHAGQRWQFG